MRGEESATAATVASRFIGEDEARLPREEEWRSSAMLRFAMEFSRSIFSFRVFSFYH